MDENKTVKKLTKKQRLKQKKLERKENILEKRRELMREHLQRELKYGLSARKKHETNWRSMLAQATLPHRREQLEFTWQTFERLIDAKDFIISRLMDEIRQQEDQYLISILSHVTRVDQIVAMFHGQLQALHNDFLSNIHLLKNKYNELSIDMNITSGNNINHLKSMIYGIEIKNKVRERSLRADICSKVEYEIEDKRGVTLELREGLTQTFEDMLENTNEIIEKFLKKTRKRRQEYDALKTADDKAQELLAYGVKKIQHLSVVIRKLKKKEDDIGHNELSNLEGEKKFFKRAVLALTQKLAAELKLDKAKIEFFVSEFYEAYKNINRFLKRGENMIHLLRCTKKLETSEEKARPYPICRHASDNMKQRTLFFFWQRVAKVDCSRTGLIEERNLLLSENESLKKKISEIRSCLSCPVLPPIHNREGPIPFTDGVTEMRKYEKWWEVKRR